MLVIRAGIYKMLVRKANRENPGQTASSKAVWSGSAQFVSAFFGKKLEFKILEHLLYPMGENFQDYSWMQDFWGWLSIEMHWIGQIINNFSVYLKAPFGAV